MFLELKNGLSNNFNYDCCYLQIDLQMVRQKMVQQSI